MRDYLKVSSEFWIGSTGRRLRHAGPEAQVVALYLLTSPHANTLGLYYCPLTVIAHETGLSTGSVSIGLRLAIEAGFCHYDEDTEMVWVVEMAACQIGKSLKAGDLKIKGVQREYDSLRPNRHLPAFYEKYACAFNMKSCRLDVSSAQGGEV